MMRLLFSVVQVWLLLCATSCLHSQTFNLQTGRESVASLDGLWRFHTGDNPAWADPNFDDSQWPVLRSDEPWNQQGYKNYGGFAWYRFTVTVPEGNRNWYAPSCAGTTSSGDSGMFFRQGLREGPMR